MDSAQSILPNIATFFGLIPFLLVVFLDMLGLGKFDATYFRKRELAIFLCGFFCLFIRSVIEIF